MWFFLLESLRAVSCGSREWTEIIQFITVIIIIIITVVPKFSVRVDGGILASRTVMIRAGNPIKRAGSATSTTTAMIPVIILNAVVVHEWIHPGGPYPHVAVTSSSAGRKSGRGRCKIPITIIVVIIVRAEQVMDVRTRVHRRRTCARAHGGSA